MNCLLLLLLTFGGSVVSGFYDRCREDFMNCQNVWPADVFVGFSFPPNAEQLKRICGPAQSVLDCGAQTARECTGMSFEELAAMDNRTVSVPAQFFLNMASIAVDICDENSSLHIGYVNTIDCVKEMINRGPPLGCKEEAVSFVKPYWDSIVSTSEEEAAEQTGGDADCLVASYILACVALDVQKTCGEEARVVAMELFRRSQFMKLQVCTGHDVVNLKANFLEYLQQEGEKREVFAMAFDVRKRRK